MQKIRWGRPTKRAHGNFVGAIEVELKLMLKVVKRVEGML